MALGTVSYINVMLEVFGGMLSLVLASCLVVMRQRGNRLHTLLIATCVFGGCSQLFDAVAWIVEGAADPFANLVMRAAVFLTYVFDFAQLGALAQYIATYLMQRDERFPAWLAWSGWAAAGLVVALVAVNAFFPVFYTFEGGLYVETEAWAMVTQGVMCMFLVAGVAFVLRSRRRLEPYALGVLGASLGILLVTYALQSLVGGVLLIYLATTFATVLLYLGVQMEQARAFHAQQMALERSRTDLMMSQIQPHFLYNVLAAIHGLVDVDAHEAQQAICEFSSYLRTNMDTLSQSEPILFEQELDHVRTYMALERRRFGGRVRMVEELGTLAFCVPALTVQPLVENAVRHGIAKSAQGGTIRLVTREMDDCFQVIVADDGVGFQLDAPLPADGRSHVGLASVRERLARMCGADMEVESAPGAGTTVTIRVPKDLRAKEEAPSCMGYPRAATRDEGKGAGR